jgi:hypothetical protein
MLVITISFRKTDRCAQNIQSDHANQARYRERNCDADHTSGLRRILLPPPLVHWEPGEQPTGATQHGIQRLDFIRGDRHIDAGPGTAAKPPESPTS